MEALLKEVLADDELPDYLLQGDIAVLYKKKERADPRNYRPITLVPTTRSIQNIHTRPSQTNADRSTRTDATSGKKGPEVEATQFRIRCQFKSGKSATKHGIWYMPVLAARMAKTAAETGQLPGFDRTQSRKAQHKNKMTTVVPPGPLSASGVKRAGSRSAWADSGHESDDSHAESDRSKLARGLGRLGQQGSPSGEG